MKKIMSDKSFWIILIISVVTLIGLTLGVIFLTRQNSREFYSAGYIINSTAGKSDRYYFDEQTVYKENVFNEYVFKDVDNREVSTNKNNFIHYLDNSLSFMKNGVILDLDNFNENIVPYYNITDKSIIKYNNGGYYIETADKTLVFGNFLGRITDNKYIVVGNDIRVKLAGNDESVSGDYFEILFVEDGIVKIENQDGSYQTISDGTVIYIGDSIKINLGDKTLNYGEEAKLNLTELTIDGNENIDIVPEEGLVDKDNDAQDDTNNPAGDSANNDVVAPDAGKENDKGGSEEGDEPNGETTTVLKKEVAVNLIDAETTINSIRAKFQVIDTMEAIKGDLVIELLNITTGKYVELNDGAAVLVNTFEEQDKFFSDLTPDCNYLMTVKDRVGTQYFQKSFMTSDVNLKLRREMVTENSLEYSLDFGINSDVTMADILIFDETDKEVPIDRVTIKNGVSSSVVFENLKNNTTYVVRVDNVYIKNVLDNNYTATTVDMTLKNKPSLGNISVKTNNDAKIFTLMLDSNSIVDEDKAIVKYTYQIYKCTIDDNNIEQYELVHSFDRNEVAAETLKIDQEKKLFPNTDYKFKVIAQYYDNYRYNEIETGLSDDFNVTGLPTIRFEPEEITINKISGKVVFEDESCLVSFDGRECNDAPNKFRIQYYDGVTMIRKEILFETKDNIDSKNLSLYFELDGLKQDTPHIFDVYAEVDLKNGDEKSRLEKHIGSFTVRTEGIDGLKIQQWTPGDYSYETPISVTAEMVSTTADNNSLDKLYHLTFKLYKDDATINSGEAIKANAIPIATYTVSGNIDPKNIIINSNMFEYTDSETKEKYKITNLDVLKQLSGGYLSEQYTIEITDAKDIGGDNEFEIVNRIYVYNTPKILLLEDSVYTNIVVDEITNENTNDKKYGIQYNSSLNNDIIRGYAVTADFNESMIINKVGSSNAVSKINFYVHDKNGKLIDKKTINYNEEKNRTVYFLLGDGTDYNTVDSDLRRGNTYKFSYDLSIDEDRNVNTDDIIFPLDKPVSDAFESKKQAPIIKYYIDNSTDTTITYKYQVSDYDNALYSEDGKYYIHYKIMGTEEDYVAEYVIDNSIDTFTLSNLSNGVIYSIGYSSALIKNVEPAIVNTGNYYFDGYYNLNEKLKYELQYSNNSNELKIVIEDNEFLNRVSSYLLTMTAEGVDNKYQKVISNLSTCGENKCIVINYKDLNTKDIPFKGKKITVNLDAFYDTGFIGFGQDSKLNDYFKRLGYEIKDNAKFGFVYQTTGTNDKGEYFYNISNANYTRYATPKGIVGFELIKGEQWSLNTVELLDVNKNKFVAPGDIVYRNANVVVSRATGSVNIVGGVTVNPKVLDKINVTTDNDNFKFTSIIPSVTVKNVKSLINGATMSVIPSVNGDLLKTDYIDTNGKYMFYIDIYEEVTCSDEVTDDCVSGEKYKKHIKTVDVDYDNLENVYFDGLNPATNYKYTISADMNKNGNKVKTLLFDSQGRVFDGDVVTLTKEKILAGPSDVRYGYTSTKNSENYSNRKLYVDTYLNKNYRDQLVNFDLKLSLSNDNREEFVTTDGNGQNQEFIIISKEVIKQAIDKGDNNIIVNYVHDITGNDFVFGSGYHELVITAVTTGVDNASKELELYRGKLENNGASHMFKELLNPTISLVNEAHMSSDNNISYNHTMTSTIIVVDTDKVIVDGIFYAELQDATYTNACPDNPENCKIKVDIKNNKCEKVLNGKVKNCELEAVTSNEIKIMVKFDDLKENTNYSIYAYADTYRNNVDLTNKEQLVYVRKNQYTKNEFDFSLGAVTPTARSKKELVITFANSANLNKDSVVGIKYTVNVQGAGTVASGILGKINSNDVEELTYKTDSDGYPTIDIPLNGGSLGLNNYIIITYYYIDKNDNNAIKPLELNGSTSFQYTVKNEFK